MYKRNKAEKIRAKIKKERPSIVCRTNSIDTCDSAECPPKRSILPKLKNKNKMLHMLIRKNLSILNMRGCKQFSEMHLMHILPHLSKLNSVCLQECQEISFPVAFWVRIHKLRLRIGGDCTIHFLKFSSAYHSSKFSHIMGHMFVFRMTGIDYRIVFQYQQMIHTSKLVPSEVKYTFKCTALCSFEELNKTWLKWQMCFLQCVHRII